MQEPWVREVEGCKDRFERNVILRVTLDEKHRVMLLSPPGECAVLPGSEQIQEVKQALTDAQVESTHRRKSGS